MKEELDPIFKKFAKPSEDGPVLKSFLKFTARLNDPEQYPPGFLEKWLRDRAQDHRVISYIFPGEAFLAFAW